MTALPTLNRDLGLAERSLGALLAPLLDAAGLSFVQWTTMIFVGDDGLARSELLARQVAGRVATEPEAAAQLAGLMEAGLVVGDEAADARLTLTEAGARTFADLREEVAEITQALWGDLPPRDLEATQRTLQEVIRRARRLATDAARR